jgi:hypothetical protein
MTSHAHQECPMEWTPLIFSSVFTPHSCIITIFIIGIARAFRDSAIPEHHDQSLDRNIIRTQVTIEDGTS